jgi:hypothetical protein|tara:strand:+ start:122 stop:364 length:243 start_codon:yes stop_codon:yes gene_type:complete
MKSQMAFDWINDKIAKGMTVAITTGLKAIHVSPKTYKAFEDAGQPMFKMNKANDLLMAEGKSYVCIATPDMVLVKVSAHS